MEKVYELTDFSKTLFPSFGVQPLAELKELDPFVFNKAKGGYRYHRVVIYRIYGKRYDKYGLETEFRNFIYGAGWISDGFWENAERNPRADYAVEYDVWSSGSFDAAWNDIMKRFGKPNSVRAFGANERIQNLIGNAKRVLVGFNEIMTDAYIKPPVSVEFTCATNMLERDGFIEGCAYEGAVPAFAERGYILVRDDAGVEKLLPSEFFRVES